MIPTQTTISIDSTVSSQESTESINVDSISLPSVDSSTINDVFLQGVIHKLRESILGGWVSEKQGT